MCLVKRLNRRIKALYNALISIEKSCVRGTLRFTPSPEIRGSVVGARQGLVDTLGRAGTGEDQGRTLSRATEESFEFVACGANPCFSLRSTDFSAYGLIRL